MNRLGGESNKVRPACTTWKRRVSRIALATELDGQAMSNSERVFLVIVGAILLLPAACSVAFTPMMFSYEVGGSAFAAWLFYLSLGYAIALGGLRLLHASKRGNWSAPAPRWLSICSGLVLLLPGVSAAIVIWGLISGAFADRNEEYIFLVIVAPFFVILGVYNLWRAMRPPAIV